MIDSFCNNTDYIFSKLGVDLTGMAALNELHVNDYLCAIYNSYSIDDVVQLNNESINYIKTEYFIEYDYLLDNYKLLYNLDSLYSIFNVLGKSFFEIELFNNLIILYDSYENYFLYYANEIDYDFIYDLNYKPQQINDDYYMLFELVLHDYEHLNNSYYSNIDALEILTNSQSNHDTILFFISVYIDDYFNYKVKFDQFSTQFNDFKHNVELDINYILNYLTIVNELDQCSINEIDDFIKLISTYSLDIDEMFDSILNNLYEIDNNPIYKNKNIKDSECIKYLVDNGVIVKDEFEVENNYYLNSEIILNNLLDDMDNISILNYKDINFFNNLKESQLPSNKTFEYALEISYKKLDKYIIE